MSDLTQDEMTVLLIAKEGQWLAPIGRWRKPILDLTLRGLMCCLDEVNYVISERGRQAIAEQDAEDFQRIKEVQDKILSQRAAVVQQQVETAVAVSEPLCEQCQGRIDCTWVFCPKCGFRLRSEHA